jgi:hypothetical protein
MIITELVQKELRRKHRNSSACRQPDPDCLSESQHLDMPAPAVYVIAIVGTVFAVVAFKEVSTMYICPQTC